MKLNLLPFVLVAGASFAFKKIPLNVHNFFSNEERKGKGTKESEKSIEENNQSCSGEKENGFCGNDNGVLIQEEEDHNQSNNYHSYSENDGICSDNIVNITNGIDDSVDDASSNGNSRIINDDISDTKDNNVNTMYANENKGKLTKLAGGERIMREIKLGIRNDENESRTEKMRSLQQRDFHEEICMMLEPDGGDGNYDVGVSQKNEICIGTSASECQNDRANSEKHSSFSNNEQSGNSISDTLIIQLLYHMKLRKEDEEREKEINGRVKVAASEEKMEKGKDVVFFTNSIIKMSEIDDSSVKNERNEKEQEKLRTMEEAAGGEKNEKDVKEVKEGKEKPKIRYQPVMHSEVNEAHGIDVNEKEKHEKGVEKEGKEEEKGIVIKETKVECVGNGEDEVIMNKNSEREHDYYQSSINMEKKGVGAKVVAERKEKVESEKGKEETFDGVLNSRKMSEYENSERNRNGKNKEPERSNAELDLEKEAIEEKKKIKIGTEKDKREESGGEDNTRAITIKKGKFDIQEKGLDATKGGYEKEKRNLMQGDVIQSTAQVRSSSTSQQAIKINMEEVNEGSSEKEVKERKEEREAIEVKEEMKENENENRENKVQVLALRKFLQSVVAEKNILEAKNVELKKVEVEACVQRQSMAAEIELLKTQLQESESNLQKEKSISLENIEEVGRLRKIVSIMQKKLVAMEKQIVERKEEVMKKKEAEKNLQQFMELKTKERENFMKTIQDLKALREDANARMRKKEKEAEEERERAKKLEVMVHEEKEKKKNVEQMLKENEDKIRELEDDIGLLKRTNKMLNTKIEWLVRSLKEMEEEKNELSSMLEASQKDLPETIKEASGLPEKIWELIDHVETDFGHLPEKRQVAKLKWVIACVRFELYNLQHIRPTSRSSPDCQITNLTKQLLMSHPAFSRKIDEDQAEQHSPIPSNRNPVIKLSPLQGY